MKAKKTRVLGRLRLAVDMPERFAWKPAIETPLPEEMTLVATDESLADHLDSKYCVPTRCMAAAAVDYSRVPVIENEAGEECVAVEHLHWLQQAAVSFADGHRVWDNFDQQGFAKDCRVCGASIHVCMLRDGPSLFLEGRRGYVASEEPEDE